MRLLILLTTSTLALLAGANAQQTKGDMQATARSPEESARMIRSAQLRYTQQVNTMLQAAIAHEFMRHHERLNGGSVKYAFKLDSRGRVVSLEVHSTKNSRWGEETLGRIVRSLKFPAVPAETMKEFEGGHKFIKVRGSWKYQP